MERQKKCTNNKVMGSLSLFIIYATLLLAVEMLLDYAPGGR
jgi:hypothetical protein